MTRLRAFTGELIIPEGRLSMRVSDNGYSEDLSLSVTLGKGPSLIGRDSLREIRTDWEDIFGVKKIARQEI